MCVLFKFIGVAIIKMPTYKGQLISKLTRYIIITKTCIIQRYFNNL
jgi:hypothetical protein